MSAPLYSQAELAAAIAAVKADIAQNVPSWEAEMIPAAAIQSAVAAGLAAAAQVRAKEDETKAPTEETKP